MNCFLKRQVYKKHQILNITRKILLDRNLTSLIQTMQNSWKQLTFGLLSLFALGYYFKQYQHQEHFHLQKLQEFNQTYQESQTKPLSQIIYKHKQHEHSLPKMVCLIDLKPKYNQTTFKLYQRQRSVFIKQSLYPPNTLLKNQMGGDFTFKLGSETVKCKLNDFHLSSSLLRQQATPVHLFKGINEIEPIVCTVVTSLSSLMNVSLYGKLYYDDNNFRWTVQPFFLTAKNELKKVVQEFYKNEIDTARLFKFAIFVGGMVLSYFTIYKPLKVLLSSYLGGVDKEKINRMNETQFFKNKEYLMVNKNSLLNCENCNARNVEMVYECGHLALCLQCHQQNPSKTCPVCHTKSTKFMKIFMA